MPCVRGVLQEAVQEGTLLLNQGHFDRSFWRGFGVQEVVLAAKKDVHPGACHTQNISCVFVDVPLEVHDIIWTCQQGSLIGLRLRVLLEGSSIGIGVISLRSKRSNLTWSKSSCSRP